jgi:hypothetical protein
VAPHVLTWLRTASGKNKPSPWSTWPTINCNKSKDSPKKTTSKKCSELKLRNGIYKISISVWLAKWWFLKKMLRLWRTSLLWYKTLLTHRKSASPLLRSMELSTGLWTKWTLIAQTRQLSLWEPPPFSLLLFLSDKVEPAKNKAVTSSRYKIFDRVIVIP